MLDDFMARGARLRGVRLAPSRFKGRAHFDALWLGTREIAHCHNGLRGPGYDWILVRVRRKADVERALELLRHAIRVARI